MTSRQLFAAFTGLLAAMLAPLRLRTKKTVTVYWPDGHTEQVVFMHRRRNGKVDWFRPPPAPDRLVKLSGLDGKLVMLDCVTWQIIAAEV